MSTTTSDPQHLQRLRAAERSRQIRMARAALKRRIVAGEITVASVLLECPPEAENWPVRDALMAQWRWGRTRALKLLSRSQVVETKPVGRLTERQRRLLADALSRSRR